MFEFDENKRIQINQILHIVKIASLSFPAIAFFQYYVKSNASFQFLRHGILLIAVLLIILAFYSLWSFLQVKLSSNSIMKTWIDPAISLTIAFLSVMFTGTYQSNYKFLFLFVIISSSIECDLKLSMSISAISAVIILAIDLIFTPVAAVNTFFESDLVLACVFLIISWTIGFYVNLENKHIEDLKLVAKIDGLTGLYNHRYFYDSLIEKLGETKNGSTLALLFIDIDYFKNYNDLFGHQKGDEVLKIIARMLKEYVREEDIISRYGGEEFAIILPNTTEADAITIAEEIRCGIQEQYFPGQEYLPNENLTVSVGLSVYPNKAKTEIELVKHADDALYRAKFLRRNRVESYYSILDDIQRDASENEKETLASIKTLIAVINARDKYTFRHVERVVSYCSIVADKLMFDDYTKRVFIHAAYIHDIGKINIPQEILIKSTPLTSEEWDILRAHPRNAVEIIKNVTMLKDVVPIILQHHERYDGTGYPSKIKGKDILYLARLLTVIDSFDAMTSNRPYQKKKSYTEAFLELERCSGTQFDPDIVKDFIKILREDLFD